MIPIKDPTLTGCIIRVIDLVTRLPLSKMPSPDLNRIFRKLEAVLDKELDFLEWR